MCRAEGLEEARGGGTVSAPQRDDAIHSWDEGVRTNVYRSVSPSISLSLFPPTCTTTTCYPPPSVFRGTELAMET